MEQAPADVLTRQERRQLRGDPRADPRLVAQRGISQEREPAADPLAAGALGDAVEQLRVAGHAELADQVEAELIGRNVVAGRWTFQVVEEYDDGYYATFKRLEAKARESLVDGRRHLFEAEMKEDRRTHGRPGHEAAPEPGR